MRKNSLLTYIFERENTTKDQKTESKDESIFNTKLS
jgi:hypothetical protein